MKKFLFSKPLENWIMLFKYKNISISLLRLNLHSMSKILRIELLLGLCTSLDPVGTRQWSPSFGSCKKNDHHICYQSFLALFVLEGIYIMAQEYIKSIPYLCTIYCKTIWVLYYVTMMVSEKIFFIILIEIYICIFKILWIICWHFELLETVLICAQYVFGCNTVIYVGNFQNTDRINFWRYILQHVSQKYFEAIFIVGRKFFFKHAVYDRNFPIHSSLNLRRILLS